MTGFGTARRRWDNGPGGLPHSLVVELRGVNQRFREIKIRQPFGLAWEARIRQRIEERIGRGRIDAVIALKRVGESDQSAQSAQGLDLERLQGALENYLAHHKLIAEKLAHEELQVSRVNILELLKFIRSSEAQESPRDEPAREPPAALEEAVEEAVGALVAMRIREGAALEAALSAHVDTFEAQVAAIAEAVEGEGERLQEVLTSRITALLQGTTPLDPARIAQEVAILVQRADIAEEEARIASHLHQLRGILSAPPAVGDGKTLDFLCQELFREITTIGSKITSHHGSRAVVEAKGSVERIREQVQNVE